MNFNSKIAGTALIAVAGLIAAPAGAATFQQITSGQSYDGWTVTFGSDIQLDEDTGTTGTDLQIEKFAQFEPADASGLMITFTQSSATAASQVTITNETITNLTGSSFSGFQFLLLNLSGGNASFSSSNLFAPPVGYSTVNYSPQSIIYTGTQANSTTSDWGMGSDGDLVLNLDPAGVGTSVAFDEVPTTGTTPPTVPLPAAAWQSLVGLAGLGLIAVAKRKIA